MEFFFFDWWAFWLTMKVVFRRGGFSAPRMSGEGSMRLYMSQVI